VRRLFFASAALRGFQRAEFDFTAVGRNKGCGKVRKAANCGKPMRRNSTPRTKPVRGACAWLILAYQHLTLANQEPNLYRIQ
jgi:hypothetical protein